MKYKDFVDEIRNDINCNSLFKAIQINRGNNWHTIISCVDWMSRSAKIIDSKVQEKYKNTGNEMYLYSYISSIDIFFVSYLKFNMFINNTNYKVNIYQKGSNYFKDSYYNASIKISQKNKNNDADTFKHIRALLVAHPMDLEIPRGGNKYVASWPNIRGKYIELGLWSEKWMDADIVSVKISIGDLEEFFDSIVKNLRLLIDKIPKEIEDHIDICVNTPIKKTNNFEEEIYVLLEENKKRFNNNFLKEYLEVYKQVLSVKSNNNIMDIYQEYIRGLLVKLRKELQNMNIISNFTYKCYPSTSYGLSKKYGYVIAKAYQSNDNTISDIEEELNEYLGSIDEEIIYNNDLDIIELNDYTRTIMIWAKLHYKVSYIGI